MSEYTPTTDEMRAFYTAERLDGPHLEGFPPPTVDQAEAEFNAWLSAHDAEVRAGVVAEEPEWEYGVKFDDLPGRVFDRLPGDPRATHRRRKAGPWVPVEQEGAETDA